MSGEYFLTTAKARRKEAVCLGCSLSLFQGVCATRSKRKKNDLVANTLFSI